MADKKNWLRLLAYVTGSINQELLLRNEYLTAENHILKSQIKGRLLVRWREGDLGRDCQASGRLGLRSHRWSSGQFGSRDSDQSVGNILRRHEIAPAPKRKQSTTWSEFIRSYLDVLAGTDFFTVKVLTWRAWRRIMCCSLFIWAT